MSLQNYVCYLFFFSLPELVEEVLELWCGALAVTCPDWWAGAEEMAREELPELYDELLPLPLA